MGDKIVQRLGFSCVFYAWKEEWVQAYLDFLSIGADSFVMKVHQ